MVGLHDGKKESMLKVPAVMKSKHTKTLTIMKNTKYSFRFNGGKIKENIY